jgi:hypothetical protein
MDLTRTSALGPILTILIFKAELAERWADDELYGTRTN